MPRVKASTFTGLAFLLPLSTIHTLGICVVGPQADGTNFRVTSPADEGNKWLFVVNVDDDVTQVKKHSTSAEAAARSCIFKR